MSDTMTQSERPPVGEVLTPESVKLLREGDWLRVTSPGGSLDNGEVVRFVRLPNREPGRIYVSGRDYHPFICDRFTFLGRPDADGWIKNPGFNPAPGMRVDVRYRDTWGDPPGAVGKGVRLDSAESWMQHEGPEYVTHWRPAPAQPAPRSDVSDRLEAECPPPSIAPSPAQSERPSDMVEQMRAALDQALTMVVDAASEGHFDHDIFEELRALAASPSQSPGEAPASGKEDARDRLESLAADLDTLAVSTKYDSDDRARWEAVRDDVLSIRSDLRSPAYAAPVAVTIFCQACGVPHVDEGEWATTRHHKTHQCQSCGHEWRPFPFATVGVAHPPSASDGRVRVAAKMAHILRGMLARGTVIDAEAIERAEQLAAYRQDPTADDRAWAAAEAAFLEEE